MAGQAIVTIRDKQWQCAVANTPQELAGGLSGVESILPGTGMLFDMGWDHPVIDIYTDEMLFPLDVIFINSVYGVVGVLRNIQPGDEALFQGEQGARFFFEINAGEAEGIEIGHSVLIQPGEEIPEAPSWITGLVGIAGFVTMGIFMVGIVRNLTKKDLGEREEKPALLPHASPKQTVIYYEIETDRMGNIIVTRSDDPGKDVFLQFEADKCLVYDLLRKGEKKDLDAGWEVKVKRSEPRASILDELWESAAQPRNLPQTKKQDKPISRKPTRSDVAVDSWTERDRLGIWLTDRRTDKTIAEWWDEDAREMFDQGWFKPGDVRHQTITGRAFEESVLDYAESVGILTPTISPAIKPRPNGDTPVADLVEKWSKAKRNSALALKDLETISQRYDIADCKEALLEYRDAARSDYSDSEEYQEARDEAWEAFIECLESLSGEEESEMEEKDERETSGKGGAVIPEQPRSLRSKDKLEFLPDSPEFLAYTIDDIGYREKIDSAFLGAIARAKGGKQW